LYFTPTPEIANLPFGLVDYVIKHPTSIETAEAMDAPLINSKGIPKRRKSIETNEKEILKG
jgi:hypothetical protein